MTTEAEVIALTKKKMDDAKDEMVAEFSAYLDYHLERFGLFVMPTERSFKEWQSKYKKSEVQ